MTICAGRGRHIDAFHQSLPPLLIERARCPIPILKRSESVPTAFSFLYLRSPKTSRNDLSRVGIIATTMQACRGQDVPSEPLPPTIFSLENFRKRQKKKK